MGNRDSNNKAIGLGTGFGRIWDSGFRFQVSWYDAVFSPRMLWWVVAGDEICIICSSLPSFCSGQRCVSCVYQFRFVHKFVSSIRDEDNYFLFSNVDF